MTLPFISVIIPVYNNSKALVSCLTAVLGQDYPAIAFEIIIIDNASNPPLELPELICEWPSVTAVIENRPGSYAARNRGIVLAKGDILAFTDADCLPTKSWLRSATDRLAIEPRNTVLGGQIAVFPKILKNPTPVEIYDMNFGLRQARYVHAYGFAATANLIASRQAFEVVGKFDPELKSGGDHEWGARAGSKGFRIVYAPEVEVLHPARQSLTNILSKIRRTAGGHHDLRADADGRLELNNRKNKRIRLIMESSKQLFHIQRRFGVTAFLCVIGVAASTVAVRVMEWTRLFFGQHSLRQ